MLLLVIRQFLISFCSDQAVQGIFNPRALDFLFMWPNWPQELHLLFVYRSGLSWSTSGTHAPRLCNVCVSPPCCCGPGVLENCHRPSIPSLRKLLRCLRRRLLVSWRFPGDGETRRTDPALVCRYSALHGASACCHHH